MSTDNLTAPEFERSALITIDVQRDFLDDRPFEIRGTAAVLPTIAHLLDAYRRRQRPIVHVVRLYRDDGSNVEPSRRHIMAGGHRLVSPGSDGSQLAEMLLPSMETRLDAPLLLAGGVQEVGPRETIIYKPRWGAFYCTPLETHLRADDVTTLIFTGCNFPNCPRTSMYEASERDFRVVLVDDAVSGIDGQGREELRGIGVRVMNAANVVSALMASPESPVAGL